MHITWAPVGATFLSDVSLQGSLLFTGRQSRAVHSVVFAADGRTVALQERLLALQERLLAGQFGRLRAVAAPDGSCYVPTSNHDDRVLRGVFG